MTCTLIGACVPARVSFASFYVFSSSFLFTLPSQVVAGIAATGTNVVVTGGTVSEMALHFCEKYNLMVVKSPSKWDIRRLCATVGATALTRLGPATPEEVNLRQNT